METLFLKLVEVTDCISFDAILILPVFMDQLLLKRNLLKILQFFRTIENHEKSAKVKITILFTCMMFCLSLWNLHGGLFKRMTELKFMRLYRLQENCLSVKKKKKIK